MRIIGISGKKRHGKDTFYELLKGLTTTTVMKVAFADALKEEVFERVLGPDGFSKSVLDDENTKAAFRPLLQWWGTEYKRKMFYDDYWIKKSQNTLEQLKQQYGEGDAHPLIVCVTDVRYPNECRMIQKLGGQLVRITRPNFGEADSHISETALDDWTEWDYEICNDGNLDDYQDAVHNLTKEWKL